MIALDIETVPDEKRIQSRQWAEYKEKKQITDDQDAALHPAFGRVVCICAYDTEGKRKLSTCGDDEHKILTDFLLFGDRDAVYGGHFIKGFDLPFLANRFVANALNPPLPMCIAGKKPWEIPHIDTVELLKFGGNMHISLDAACLMFGIPSPKEGEVNGLGVWKAYQEKKFDVIASYCGRDVNAWFSVFGALKKVGAC